MLAKSDLVSIVDSLVAPMSVINALIVALCMQRQKEVSLHLEQIDAFWDDYQVYQQDEIDPVVEEIDMDLKDPSGEKN